VAVETEVDRLAGEKTGVSRNEIAWALFTAEGKGNPLLGAPD